jgi:hypothetical protein
MTGIRSRSLVTGVRVYGPFEDLGDNPRGHKRHVRQRICGVIVCTVWEHKYKMIHFENDTEKVCLSTSLKVEVATLDFRCRK